MSEAEKARKLREEEDKLIEELKEKKNGCELVRLCRGLPPEIARVMLLIRIKAKATYPGMTEMIPRFKRSLRVCVFFFFVSVRTLRHLQLALRDAYNRAKTEAESKIKELQDRLKKVVIEKNIEIGELRAQLEELQGKYDELETTVDELRRNGEKSLF